MASKLGQYHLQLTHRQVAQLCPVSQVIHAVKSKKIWYHKIQSTTMKLIIYYILMYKMNDGYRIL